MLNPTQRQLIANRIELLYFQLARIKQRFARQQDDKLQADFKSLERLAAGFEYDIEEGENEK